MRQSQPPVQDTFVPLADDQRHWYATETPADPDEREYDRDHGQWLSRPSDR